MSSRNWVRAACAAMAGGCFFCGAAHAVDWRPDAVEVQAGPGKNGLAAASAGVIWDWNTRWERYALITGQTELILTDWHARAIGGGHQDLQQVALLPLFHLQLDRGRSPWFIELGIGVSWLSRDYVTPTKTFGSRWNFYDVLGGGYRFGDAQKQEIGVRLVHVSNAGLRKPNPGEEVLFLRYAHRF